MHIPTTYLEPATVKCPPQLPRGDCRDCKSIVNIGIFFDGTSNSMYIDKDNDGHSNVARLSALYRHEPDYGYFRHYIQGVGTPFKEIGELGSSTFGSAFAAGGEARILWGLLQVLNSMHQFINNSRRLFETEQMALLVSHKQKSTQYPATDDDHLFDTISRQLGTDIKFGLNGWEEIRHSFLMKCHQKLSAQLAVSTPGISGVYLDVFGFSRGAAQARVFCNWLHQSLLLNGKLCGVPAYVRMLGIFDTVSSVGLSQVGHKAWASADNLRIHPAIKNCVHYVALHEFRNNFPLDSVCVGGVLPPNCCEQIGPGMHSDVGGGYEPGEQGKGIRLVTPDPFNPGYKKAVVDNSYKLSQLPLHLMLEAAKKARENHNTDSAPWQDFEPDTAKKRPLGNQFICQPAIRTSVENYFAKCGIAPYPVDDALQHHLKLYLAWRYAVSQSEAGFTGLESVRFAPSTDAKPHRVQFYLEGQKILLAQMKSHGVGGGYHPKAPEILKHIKTLDVPWAIAQFFDRYTHDSYAGFIGQFGINGGTINGMAHIVAEPKRYLTYRALYQGDDIRRNA